MKKGFRLVRWMFVVALCLVSTQMIAAQTDVKIQLQEGLNLLQNQNFESALSKFQAILQVEPDSGAARRGLAIALIGTEKFAEASREIAKLLARSPKDAPLLEMAAQTFWQQKRFVETEIVLRRRLDLGDERAALWSLFGDALDAQKKTAEAVSAYEKAVKLAPDSIDLRYALGSFYWKQIRYDDAEREFLEILKREPNEPRASFNLGDIYLTNGEAVKAIPLLEIAVKAFPAEFDTRFALGRALLLTNKYQAAIGQLESAVKLRPEIAEGYYQLGFALQKSGRRDEAKNAFKKVRELQKAKLDSEAPTGTPRND